MVVISNASDVIWEGASDKKLIPIVKENKWINFCWETAEIYSFILLSYSFMFYLLQREEKSAKVRPMFSSECVEADLYL